MPTYLSSIGTAIPPFRTSQDEIGQYMIDNLNLDSDQSHSLRVLYRASGIGHRYSVVPDFSDSEGIKFFKNGSSSYVPSVSVRMDKYETEALNLGIEAMDEALENTSLKQKDITHLVTVSCTGMYAPGLDIDLIQNTSIPTTVERTSINFMGCYAVFTALKAAKNIVEANENAVVAIVSVELCSLHLQKKTDQDSLLSNALFGDGAACAIITSGGVAKKELNLLLQHSDLALHGKSEMKWNINEVGFEMKLTAKVPELIERDIRALTEMLLFSLSKRSDEIDYYAIHPGGKRILEVIESELGITREENMAARQILRSHGNMSSPTILFVLKLLTDNFDDSDNEKEILSFAFGPGLTLESMLMKIVIN